MNYFIMLTWCCGSMLCFLCVSRMLFRMSLVMVVRHMLCSVLVCVIK